MSIYHILLSVPLLLDIWVSFVTKVIKTLYDHDMLIRSPFDKHLEQTQLGHTDILV